LSRSHCGYQPTIIRKEFKMGMDIMNWDVSYNWSSWRGLFEIGVAFGWTPRGTLSPKDRTPEWSGGYFSNDFQVLTAEDAAAWARAIMAALAAARGEVEMTAEQRRLLESASEDWLKRMEEFARIAAAGELVLG
jgi:hypothetical protein